MCMRRVRLLIGVPRSVASLCLVLSRAATRHFVAHSGCCTSWWLLRVPLMPRAALAVVPSCAGLLWLVWACWFFGFGLPSGSFWGCLCLCGVFGFGAGVSVWLWVLFLGCWFGWFVSPLTYKAVSHRLIFGQHQRPLQAHEGRKV